MHKHTRCINGAKAAIFLLNASVKCKIFLKHYIRIWCATSALQPDTHTERKLFKYNIQARYVSGTDLAINSNNIFILAYLSLSDAAAAAATTAAVGDGAGAWKRKTLYANAPRITFKLYNVW